MESPNARRREIHASLLRVCEHRARFSSSATAAPTSEPVNPTVFLLERVRDNLRRAQVSRQRRDEKNRWTR